MTSKSIPSMNDFERIPPELLKEILRRLDSQHICIAVEVCKAWKALLTPSVIRSLYSPHPLVFSNSFFVELECYESRDAMYDDDIEAKNVGVVVDMQGRCYRHDIANNPVKAATHNGLIAYGKHSAELYVINPAVKRGKKIEIPASYFAPLRRIESVLPFFLAHFQFSGVHFDALTSNFVYVVGWESSGVFSNYNIGKAFWIYHSISDNWTNLSELVDFGDRSIPCCLGVYSWGCFFWYANDTLLANSNEERVVGFNIEDQHFFYIEFPQLDDEEEHRSRRRKWALKGCEDWVVLVLNVDGVFKKCWRLVRNEDGYGWVQTIVDFRMLEYLFTVFDNVDKRCRLYNINGQGWWCVANCAQEELDSHDDDVDYGHFTIYMMNMENSGIVLRSVSSCLNWELMIRNIRVRAVWPFQINNICWPLW